MTDVRSGSSEPAFDGLRILGLCDHFAESPAGGAEKVTVEVYRRLVKAGAAVRVISATPGESPGRRLVAGIPTDFVAAHDLSERLKAQVTWAPATRKATIAALDDFRPNVVHATSLHFQSALFGSAAARRRRVPVVTTGHVASMDQLPTATRWATAGYERLLGRRILQGSAAVVAVSRAVRTHLEDLGANPTRLTVVPNGVDLDRFVPGPTRREPHVVFVGRLIANKGPDLSLEAFAHAAVPHSEYLVVGDGPMRAELEGRARRLGIAGSVRFLGYRSDVESLLASAAVLVRPSRTEGQSLAMLEAMASETCVIASDIPANAELLDRGRAGVLVPPGDVVGLARSIRRVLQDHPFRARLVEQGRRIAVTHSWDTCAEATGRVLQGASKVELERAN